MAVTHYAMKSAFGTVYLTASENGLSRADFRRFSGKMAQDLNSKNPQDQILIQTVKQLEEYFSGRRTNFDLPLDLSGTPFQKNVWRELSRIPFGKTVSYADVARGMRNPKAMRAVGNANGKNPVCIIIPCHRVIASDGSIGGYSGGIENKRRLLKLEQRSSE